MTNDNYFMDEAIVEAQISLNEGGLPIGAVLVKDNEIISRGHNRLIQNNSVVLHAEMDVLEKAGRLNYEDYIKCTLYTTLSPCPMCSGALILYNIPRVVIGENTTLMGAENLLESNDVEVVVLNNLECRELFLKFVKDNPGVWEKELKKVGNNTTVKYGDYCNK
ncbi:cytosine deaminase [Methanobrevibacter gottschalkii]|uniref:Cytosine deaminase n=1 Tax=Methanobrevibacter gottschalkii TaxID=190974 RepID=A0A1H7JY82_9EURY|nr:nucleoside deaminase [Methanobrevibacter gottschalkii]MCQ2970627.1 nucleoside deaminase [archaeon]SEK79538.1 cytosine deaminase [Methanobrevibacter gottschalkii]